MSAESDALFDKAKIAFDQGDLVASDRYLRQLLTQDQNHIPARILFGALFAKAGSLVEALTMLEPVLQTNPDNIDCLGWMAIVKKLQHDLPGAIALYQRAIKLDPTDPVLYSQLGMCWLTLRRQEQAVDAFANVIRLEPAAAQGYFNLGMALKLSGSNFDSFHAFKRATILDPAFDGAYIQVFKQTQHLLNWAEARPILEAGYFRKPDSVPLAVALAVTYGKLLIPHRAEPLFKRALGISPIAGPPFAHWLQEEGRFGDAKEVLAESIKRDPSIGEAFHNLAVAKCFQVGGQSLIEAGRAALELSGLRPEARMYLFYALAKAYEAEHDFESAMRNYDLANDLAYRIYNPREVFDSTSSELGLAKLKAFYTPEFLATAVKSGSNSDRPIFVVGMIRSGTTLLDQLLSSHPDIKSVGEQPFWGLNASRAEAKWGSGGFDAKDIGLFADKYLETIGNLIGNDSKFTDKMPVNYYHLGLIRAAFPNAKIIHLRRNPVDTCLSIYTTYLGNATYFAYNQDNIVGTYNIYLQVMDHWRSVLSSDGLYELDYESLVTSPESEIKGLLEFCNLDWNEECLSPQVNRSQISTPSLFTARQPINAKSIDRWRVYEPWIGKLDKLKNRTHPPIRRQ